MTTDRPTLDTVAAAAGVSRMTVSNAYNRPDQLSTATRERVLEVAHDLGYPGPDPAARSLRRGSSATVGVLLTEQLGFAFTDPGMVSLLRGLADELGAAGQSMLLMPSEAQDVGTLVRDALVGAFVVCSMEAGDEAVLAVRARNLPLVTVGHPDLPGAPLIGTDNHGAAGTVAAHLLDLGHRRLAVVGLPGRDPGSAEPRRQPVRVGIAHRVEGFRATVAARVGSTLVVVDAAANTFDDGVRAATDLLSRPVAERPTAVFAVTDVLALAGYEAAHRLGLSVPGDVSVVGFDDIPEAARAAPPLTTVFQDLVGKGRLAARAALALVAGEAVESPLVPARLVVRESTAPPAG